MLERVRAAKGRLWDEGARPGGAEPGAPQTGALHVFATRRVRSVPQVVSRSLLAWDRAERAVDLLHRIPSAEEVLERQTRGRRCVSLIEDAAALAHGDPRHPDGLAFVIHDLCHLEKFACPEDHQGQVGFFRCLTRALTSPSWAAREKAFDDQWLPDREYVMADMNGSAVFLFSWLKMRISMAVRRSLSADRPAPLHGPLGDEERAALHPVLATLFEALGLPAELHRCAFLVAAKRGYPEEARRLLSYFEAVGATATSTTDRLDPDARGRTAAASGTGENLFPAARHAPGPASTRP